MIQRNRFLEYLDGFRNARALVIGPAAAEFDVVCQVRRLAPDRAMPVYEIDPPQRPGAHPGGAALTASTMRNLGAEVTLITPVGRGGAGQALRAVLESEGVDLIEAGNGEAVTPELIRYVSGSRQLLQIRRNWRPTRFQQLEQTLASCRSGASGAVPETGETDRSPFDVICVVDATPPGLSERDLDVIARFAAECGAPLVFDEAGGGVFPCGGEKAGGGVAAPQFDHLIVNESESRLVAARYGLDADDHIERLRRLCEHVAPTTLLTLGRNGGVVATRNDGGADRSRLSAGEAEGAQAVDISPIATPVHALSDRRGVGFVASGVCAISIAVGATAEEAGFLACNAASVAASTPGPKRLTIQDLRSIAYREIEMHVADGIEVFGRIARNHLSVIDEAARLLMQAYSEGRQALVFGNGGSAAEANHLVTELTGQFRRKRASLPCISLSSNDALATCIANDYGFEDLFARQIEAFCRPGDVVIGMSTSGRSKNVIRGMERARERGARIIAFTGEEVGPMHELADIVLAAPSRSTPRIQEAHLFTIHVMCDMLDRRVNADGRLSPSASEI